VSWGASCADPTYPGVYSRISRFSDWIHGEVCMVLSPDSCETYENGVKRIKKSFGVVRDEEPDDTSVSSGQTTVFVDAQVDAEQSCRDVYGKFEGAGSKSKKRDCKWVFRKRNVRCARYRNFCKQTCGRCKRSAGTRQNSNMQKKKKPNGKGGGTRRKRRRGANETIVTTEQVPSPGQERLV